MFTDQNLDYIHGLEQLAADEISVFLVIAAKLLQIKSEALLPRPPVHEPSDEDAGQSLVEQLRLYKRYKEIAAWLDGYQLRGYHTYLRVAPPPKVEAKLDLTGLTLERLVVAARVVFAKAPEKDSLDSVIAAPKITIRERIHLIGQALKHFPSTSFRSLLGEKPTRPEKVCTFPRFL